MFSNSLMGFKVICQLENEFLKGLAKCSRNIFLNYFFGDRLITEITRTSIHMI